MCTSLFAKLCFGSTHSALFYIMVHCSLLFSQNKNKQKKTIEGLAESVMERVFWGATLKVTLIQNISIATEE